MKYLFILMGRYTLNHTSHLFGLTNSYRARCSCYSSLLMFGQQKCLYIIPISWFKTGTYIIYSIALCILSSLDEVDFSCTWSQKILITIPWNENMLVLHEHDVGVGNCPSVQKWYGCQFFVIFLWFIKSSKT